MKLLYIFLLHIIILPFGIAHADTDQLPALPPETRIEADNEAGVIRFFVKGVEQARLTEDGFEVRNHLAYGGVLTDQGVEGFGRAASDEEASDAE